MKDMRKSVLMFILVAMVSVTGCDFLRVVAGRPTSKDIERKRLEIIRAEEAALQARLDSIARVEAEAVEKQRREKEDSVAAHAYISDNQIVVIDVARLGGVVRDELQEDLGGGRYRVVLGSFRDRRNAVSLCGRLTELGDFNAHMITFGNGMVAAAACPVDRVQDVVNGMKELKNQPLCPADVWILKCE